jgi:carboxyl-terminal processing protease
MFRKPRRRLFLILMIFVSLGAGFTGGLRVNTVLLTRVTGTVQVPEGAEDDFALLAEVWRTVEQEYVEQEELEARQMAYGAIRGLVDTLGDAGHTRFLSPEMAEQHRSQIQGKFEGIGAYVEMREGRVVIVAPMDDTPAQRAGLKAGEVILEVNGEDVSNLALDEVIQQITGPAGTEVSLTLLNSDTGETRQLDVERAEIDLDLVSWQRLPGTDLAYLRISAFSEGAAEELKEVLREIQQENVNGILLDLRSNPGGLLNEAVGVSSYFLDAGVVLQRENSQGEITEIEVREDVEAVEIPLVILSNGGSASASEIVIGAMQDQQRATVVGTTTFGAGTVLNSFQMQDGSVLLLAVEEWLTPDGRVIWKQGLEPDIIVPLPEDVAPLMRLQLRGISPEELRNSRDVQFLRALEELNKKNFQ